MKKSLFRIALISIALSLTACATDYRQYSEAVTSIEVAKHNAEAEKYKAMAAIVATGSDAAKVAAVMSMNGSPIQAQAGSALRAPETAGDTALRWASLVVPTMMQGYGIHANSLLGMRQSDNAALVAQSTNSAFVGMAGKIQAPAIPQANVTTTTTTNTTSTDSHNIANSYNPTTTTNSASGNTTPTTTTDSHNVLPTP